MTTEPGQVFRVDLGVAGKVRPMIVVSIRDEDAPRALAVCVPLTTANRSSWYEVPIAKKAFLRESSFANVQGIQAIQHSELMGLLGRVHPKELTAIREALARMLGVAEGH